METFSVSYLDGFGNISGKDTFPMEIRDNMEKLRDLDECVETERARANSLTEVGYYPSFTVYSVYFPNSLSCFEDFNSLILIGLILEKPSHLRFYPTIPASHLEGCFYRQTFNLLPAHSEFIK